MRTFLLVFVAVCGLALAGCCGCDFDPCNPCGDACGGCGAPAEAPADAPADGGGSCGGGGASCG